MSVKREALGDYPGVTTWRETSPGSGYYLPADPVVKPGPNWPQAFMVASVFLSFAAAVWAIAWALNT